MPHLSESEKRLTRWALEYRRPAQPWKGTREPDPLDVMILALERERERCLRICDQFRDNLVARYIAKQIREGK